MSNKAIRDDATVLVTGGCGFIGSNFVRFALEHRPGWNIINLDCLSYSGNLENLTDIEDDPRYEFVKGDIRNMEDVEPLVKRCDAVIHFAAESHVDRSILDAGPFITSNVQGTQVMLDAVRRVKSDGGKAPVFFFVGTDEVYGSLPLDRPDLMFTEDTPIQPRGVYSASKAGADLLVQAYHETFGLDTRTTRCSNNFGPFQFPEKVIPLFVTNLIEGQQVPLYGDGLNVRDWLHVDDHCEAIISVLEKGAAGSIYNVGGNNERTNLELTHLILKLMGKGKDMIRPVEDRLGHDRRYAIDPTRLKGEIGWQPTRSAWPEALEETVKWYVDHADWWKRVKSGAYREYYEKQYAGR
ncbi:MAG: dTDP-glucose 4,6-dehydratase [Phycisphaerales bacterium]